MGYSIVFETKICKLDNGDIIHFSLDGCNNDDAGRDRHEFSGKYYTADEWKKEVEKWENIERGEGFDLKIRNRYVQWSDYGKHLRTMTKRAKTFEEYKKERSIYGHVFDGITYYPEEGDPVSIPADDTKKIDEIVYGIWYGRVKGKYRNNSHTIYEKDEIINAVKNKEHVQFYISERRKCR